MNWITRTRGQIERLNHKLTVIEVDGNLQISHTQYGPVINLTEQDANPVNMVREILTEMSENG